MKRLVSVIVPFYNEELYLKKCLVSLCRQSYSPIEILAVDDGSTDASRIIAQSFPSVKIITQDHSGPGAARNRGVSEAQGEILVFADADMEYDVKYVSLLVEPIINGKACGTSHIDERIANPHNIWSICWSINAGHQDGKRIPSHIPEKLDIFRALRKKDFDRVGGFDSQDGYFDDRSLSKKLGKKSEIVNGARAYHHNPATLSEVFFSARWIGKSPEIRCTWVNIMRYSVFNAVRNGIHKILHGAPVAYLLFKVVYDTGMLFGILSKKTTAK